MSLLRIYKTVLINQIDGTVKPTLWFRPTTSASNISWKTNWKNQAVLKRKIAATFVAAIFTPET